MSKKNRSPWTKSKPMQPSGAYTGPEASTTLISPSQLSANRANSQLSTGPRTEAGLANSPGLAGASTPDSSDELAGRARAVAGRSKTNALKSALTGRTVLLPTDDIEEYAAFLSKFEQDLKPVGIMERELVQTVVDCHWRLRRIQELEYAIYLRGERQFAETLSEECPILRRSMIVLETHLAYQKELRNLHIQEARIDRKRIKTLAQLKALQKEREQPAQESADQNFGFASEKELFAALDAGFIPPSIAENYARLYGKSAEPKENGFDFSNSVEAAAETTETHTAAA